MKLYLLLATAVLLCHTLVIHAFEDTNLEDDDFAEFEQFDADDDGEVADFETEEEFVPINQKQEETLNTANEDEASVEDEDNEFEHFQDPEEFEGYHDTVPHGSEQPKITITQVPITRHTLSAYWLELILIVLLLAYAINYAVGRTRNTNIALEFLKVHKPLLDENFTLVGESGPDTVVINPEDPGWRREAENIYTMWCSGRLCCEGMLLTLKLIKRQDLVHVVLNAVRPSQDVLQARVEFSKDDGDPFVLCIAQKKIASKMAKEVQDLSVFCPERRPGERHGLPSSLAVLSECAEATAAVLDARVTQALTQYCSAIQYIHISDRYCGLKQVEDSSVTTPPETERVLLASFSLEHGEHAKALILLLLHLADKVKRLRLSKEALSKCEKRRQKVTEAWMRGAHAARAEQAAARREEKRKQEKEKILAEDDPEKQRRWELKEQKRQLKRKTPKMKQLKVKAL